MQNKAGQLEYFEPVGASFYPQAPAVGKAKQDAAQRLFTLEARAADLYALAYPDLSAAAGGAAWKEGPAIL